MLELAKEAEVKERALRAAESYQELARVFSSYVERKDITEQEEQTQLGREVSALVCTECPKYPRCWGEQKEECGQAFDAMAEEIGKTGRLAAGQLPEYILEHCILHKHLSEEWNRMAAEHRKKCAILEPSGIQLTIRRIFDTAVIISIPEPNGTVLDKKCPNIQRPVRKSTCTEL